MRNPTNWCQACSHNIAEACCYREDGRIDTETFGEGCQYFDHDCDTCIDKGFRYFNRPDCCLGSDEFECDEED